jgi:hypothetical protein
VVSKLGVMATAALIQSLGILLIACPLLLAVRAIAGTR